MAWIELHDYDNGGVLHINTKYILSVYKCLAYTGATTVTFVGGSDDYIHVREYVDEVMDMIKLTEYTSRLLSGGH